MGRVTRPHGLAGHVIVRAETDDPNRFRPGAALTTAAGVRLVVDEAVATEAGLRVRFAGYGDRSAAEGLRGAELTIDAAQRRPLAADEFWPDHLVGLEVRTTAGEVVGRVVELAEGAAQDRLVVETAAGSVEVPFVEALVPEVDVAGGFLVVEPIEGLLTPPST